MKNEEQNNNKYYDTFCGHKVSDYALQYGRLDYGTLAKCFNAILCNNITTVDPYIFDNVISGDFETYYYDGEEITREEYEEKEEEIDNEIETLSMYDARAEIDKLEEEKDKLERQEKDIFQWFIVSDNAVELLKECGELVLYSETLDIYIWGVDHWGTSWDYVLTSLKLKERE